MSSPQSLYRIDWGLLPGCSGQRSETRSAGRDATKRYILSRFLFGKMGEDAPPRIYQWIRENGEEEYTKMVDRAVTKLKDLEPPIFAPKPKPKPKGNPNQMELPGMTASWMNFGFTKTVETNHPGADVARSWKTANRMRFMTFDQLKEQVSDQTLPFSAKMDGELVCIWHRDGKTELVTAKGTVRTSFPPTDELQKHWETKTEIVAMGELYAVDEQNIPQPSMQSASVFKDPDAGQDQLIRLAIFDLVEMDGSKLQDKSILERMEIVRLITTGLQSVHPAYTSRGTIQDMQGVWDNLEKRGLEGLVVHMPDGTLLKSKPVLDLDLVIVAVTKSPSLPGRIGAVLTALIDKTGRYRLNGMVGAGLSDDERVSFLSWARERAVREDEDKIWIDPTKSPVVTVECAGVRPQEQPALEFKNGVYVEVEGAMSGILRSPTFQQFRPDKNPTYEDARVEQLPFKVSSLHDRIEVGKWVRTITGHTGKVTAITPSIGDSGSDWDASIAWDPPLWGIQASEVHPDDVTAIADSKEELL